MSTANRLAHEVSPYLLQHSKNPVDWYAWGPEALARSKREDRPILLSIGYSACHWCHVMERESFEDDAIAGQMNENFVCIKVDREERPDLDQIYQLVVQLMGRSGGWPLTVFLTPDQKPFFGGTYFPPADRYGVPGFPKILAAVAEAYRERRSDVDLQASELAEAIGRVSQLEAHRAESATLGPDLLARASAKLTTRFDEANAGFGTRPKFPSTMSVDLLLRHGALDHDERSLARVTRTLDAMRAGGIYDQLGGGFHRYSTDEKWLVPHFEKMLYDNALLLRLYTDGARALKNEGFAATAREIATYVAREMTHAQGGFFATQDADSEGEEGRFFVWTRVEVQQAIGGDLGRTDIVCSRFGITPRGNFEESGKTVLFEADSVPELAIRSGKGPSEIRRLLTESSEAMFDAREKRVKPFRDEKILSSWNALMIGALAEAGRALPDAAMLAAAERAFAYIERELMKEGRVLRHAKDGVVKGPGFLDDHAFVTSAALDLYEATGRPGYMATARRVADAMLAHFWDEKDGGMFFTPDDGEGLIVRAKDPFDHAIPSGTSMAATAFLRLGAIADEKYVGPATRELERLASAATSNPFGMGQTISALDRLVRGSVDVVLVGPRADARTQALADAVFARYIPHRNLAWLDPSDPLSTEACSVLLPGKAAHAEPVAYVCRSRTCSLPMTGAEELRAALEER